MTYPDIRLEDSEYTDPSEPFDSHLGGITRFDLAGLMRKGIKVPTVLDGLLYPGKMHSLAGPPEAGKSVLSLWLAWQVMQRGGPVLIVDEEAGAQSTASILLGFGADPELISEKCHYVPFPGMRWSEHDVTGLHRLLGAAKPVLSVWDSAGALMGSAGMDENSSRDVTKFWYTVLMPVTRDYQCAVLLTDHDAKDGEGSRFARGSTAKLAVVDVMLKLSPVIPFSRSRDGLVNLTVTKDRGGYLHRNYKIRYRHSPLRLEFVKSAPPSVTGRDLPPGAQRLAEVLDDTPSSIHDLVDRLVQNGQYPLRRETASTYLNILLERGMADRIDQGPGREAYWTKSADDHPDDPEPTGSVTPQPTPPDNPPASNVIDIAGQKYRVRDAADFKDPDD